MVCAPAAVPHPGARMIFVTGAAGVGKSEAVRALQDVTILDGLDEPYSGQQLRSWVIVVFPTQDLDRALGRAPGTFVIGIDRPPSGNARDPRINWLIHNDGTIDDLQVNFQMIFNSHRAEVFMRDLENLQLQ